MTKALEDSFSVINLVLLGLILYNDKTGLTLPYLGSYLVVIGLAIRRYNKGELDE